MMKRFLKAMGGALVLVLVAGSVARAEKPDPNTVTEQDKQTYQNFAAGVKQRIEAQKNKARQIQAMNNLRQIGLAMFEFETEYGEFPNEATAVTVKENTGTKADLKAATANDCFYQLCAAGIVKVGYLFTFEDRNPKNDADPKALGHLEKCDFSVLMVKTASGNPSRPMVVAPLVKGKQVFDPVALGGKAVVLRADNSVQSFPIEKDGRVMINGKDLFDPEQPFWNGDVPEIRWPKG